MRVDIIGFGNMALTHALNLRDSGYEVTLWARSVSTERLKWAGAQKLSVLKLESLGQTKGRDQDALAMWILIPDDQHHHFLHNYHQFLNPKVPLIFAHGYSLTHQNLMGHFPQFMCLLLAPKTIASEMRFFYETKRPVAGVYSVGHLAVSDQEEARILLMQLALDLGITVGPFPCQIEQETFADLYSEEVLLCGGYPYLINEVYTKLRSRGVPKELAFLECWHESYLILKTFCHVGPEKFFQLISPNALVGSEMARGQSLETVFKDLDSGKITTTLNLLSAEKIQKVRSEVQEFWAQQEITQVFHDMKGVLYDS